MLVHPCGHRPSAPMVTGGMGLGQGGAQSGIGLLAQQRMTHSRVPALVAHAVGSNRVIAARDLANPIRRVAGHTRDGSGSQSTRQEPEEVPTTALDGVMGLAIPLMQFEVGQIWLEADASWHAPVLQQSRVTPY